MTSNAARACYALTVGILRWTWRLLLALFALTLAAAATLGIGAAIRHRRSRAAQAEPVEIETPTMQLATITRLDPPTVEIPAVRALPATRHRA